MIYIISNPWKTKHYIFRDTNICGKNHLKRQEKTKILESDNGISEAIEREWVKGRGSEIFTEFIQNSKPIEYLFKKKIVFIFNIIKYFKVKN